MTLLANTQVLSGPYVCMQDNIVVSGDKKGQVAVWDFDKVHERTVYGQMHRALTNNIRSMGPQRDSYCASASTDGILKVRSPTVNSSILTRYMGGLGRTNTRTALKRHPIHASVAGFPLCLSCLKHSFLRAKLPSHLADNAHNVTRST